MDDCRLRLREQIHFALIDVDAMRGDGTRAENLKFLQSFNDTFTAMLERPILIALRLGNVDMKAGAQLVADGRSFFHRGIGNREGGVQPEERFYA